MFLVLFRGHQCYWSHCLGFAKPALRLSTSLNMPQLFQSRSPFFILCTMEDCCETHFLHSCPFEGFHIEMFSKLLFLGIKLKTSESSDFIDSKGKPSRTLKGIILSSFWNSRLLEWFSNKTQTKQLLNYQLNGCLNEKKMAIIHGKIVCFQCHLTLGF